MILTMVWLLILATLTGPALAETPALETSRASNAVVDAAENGVSPGDAVLTIHGICSLPQNAMSTSTQDCTVVVQRQQFETLLNIVAPDRKAAATAKHSLARTYATLLAFEAAAEKSGIEQSPDFLYSMEWSRLRMLADLYRHNLEKQMSAVSDQEIDDYYNHHAADFEEVKLRRMLVPKGNLVSIDKQGSEKKALEVASEFRQRAANGEDLDQLQKEVYIAAGINSLPPSTEVGTRRRSSLPSDVRQDVFTLASGGITRVENETYSFVIYKVEAKLTVPKQKVREEISREIVKQKLDAALQALTANVRTELNQDYFGPAPEQ